jgi:hypothetical protein
VDGALLLLMNGSNHLHAEFEKFTKQSEDEKTAIRSCPTTDTVEGSVENRIMRSVEYSEPKCQSHKELAPL